MTLMKMFGDFQKDTPAERNVRFGVREHGMGAIANALSLHNSGLIPYCATFFIFTDYMRPAMPNMLMMRPGDGNETAGAYAVGIANRKRPTTMALSRQAMPNLPTTSIEGTQKGAYTVLECEGTPEIIIMGTGSELQYAYEAGQKLQADGKKARVVSMPCWELSDEQSAEYKESVMPAACKNRISIE